MDRARNTSSRMLLWLDTVLLLWLVVQAVGCEAPAEEQHGFDFNNETQVAQVLAGVGNNHQLGHAIFKLQQDIYSSEQLEVCDKLFNDPYKLHMQHTLSELGLMALVTKAHTLVYHDLLIHRYDDFEELKLSTGPAANQELCLSQLRHLNDRLRAAKEENFNSKDLNLHQLLDTYGRVPSGLFLGSSMWPGMYDECTNLKLEMPQGKQPTRYCLALIKHHDWPTVKPFSDLLAMKAGLCLPKACDSLHYKDKYQLITNLMEFNARDIDVGQAFIAGLYCLPDSDSPSRMWWQQPKSLAVVAAGAAWIVIVIFSTFAYESYARKRPAASSLHQESFGLSSGMKIKDLKDQIPASVKLYKSLSIVNNIKSLFDTSKASSLMEAGDKLQDPDKVEPASSKLKRLSLVDLRCLEGIKVICMSYVIMGHVLMTITLLIANGRALNGTLSPTYYLANMVPAFAVNAFFAITGILTTYLLFKQNKSFSFMTNPGKWVAFIVYRYLRIMPMYAVVTLYCKYVSKFTGAGPHWDYGTSSWAPRRTCEQESWLWTLLFGANFKPPLEHCIPAAWYLANDFQFFVVTPIFLAALYKNPEFGKRLLKLCIGAGYLAGIMSILTVDADDLRPIAGFKPHGFKTYVTFLSHNYTRPQYRIPAYLCGLLIGYVLHTYEQDKIRYHETKEAMKARGEDTSELVEPCWSEKFKCNGASRCLIAISICCFLPMMAEKVPLNKFAAKLMVALFMSTYHIVFAVAVGCYILLAATGHGNKFVNACVSASFWKPLAKLSLCAVLVNVEVINYIVQTTTEQIYLDTYSHTSLNLLCIVATYVVSTVVYLLFEAPLASASKQLVTHVISSMARKQKTH